ncbi:MAG TPA: regulatory protein RecX [Patescibacteria group bacterium]|nr:regulatory protein RecX [Patescibacteria group bacterium]
MRLLTVRDRTSAELACQLAVRGFAQAESEAAVDRLKAEGYLNDRRFAGVWARGRIRTKPMGRLRLSKELETKGIEAQSVREVLEEIYEGGEEPYARRAMAGKLAALGRRSGQSRTPQVARFLYRRGFSAEIIWRLLHETPQE